MTAFGPVSSAPVSSIGSGFIVSGALPGTLRLNSTISVTFTGVGGTAPYTYSATGLPTGLTINASTGVVSGTASAAGTYSAIVTATDANSLTASTPTMTVVVIALPSFNYDFPVPPPRRWPPDVRTGWIWQTPTALQIPAGAYMASSKFIAYAVIVAQPYNIKRVYENPLPIAPAKWSFNWRWESGPPLSLQTTPYHPFGAQEFPARFPPIKREGFEGPSPTSLLNAPPFPPGLQVFPASFRRPRRQYPDAVAFRGLIQQVPAGAQNFPERLRRQPRQYMDHTYAIGLRRGTEDMVVSFIWG